MKKAKLSKTNSRARGEWWEADFQTTIDAYYQGRWREGRDAVERLLAVDGLPGNVEEQVRRNAVFYAQTLSELVPATVTTAVVIPVSAGWSQFNPSIAHDPRGDGFTMIVRSSNYAMSPQLHYTIRDSGNVIRTLNYLVHLAPDLQIRGAAPIDDSGVRPETPRFPVTGFEDCRLFWHEGAWRASATTREANERGICQIALLTFDGARVADIRYLSDGESRHEKNWMPISSPDGEGVLRFVYSCSPTAILRYGEAQGAGVPESIQPAPSIAKLFSGGSQAIPFHDGHLCLVHEAADFSDGGRVYLHRWVWFDRDWRLAKLSIPFRLHERGVEFAAGLALDGDHLILSYGLWDREAYLAKLPVAEVEPLLFSPLESKEVRTLKRAWGEVKTATVPLTANNVVSAYGVTPIDIPEQVVEDLAVAEGEIRPFATKRPTIVSTTLTGNSREIIGDALRSVVDWVDWLLLIDTGVSDDSLEIAAQIAGSKLVVRQFPWQNDFSAARNYALQAASELGADWAVTLDTDERLQLVEDPRLRLSAMEADTLHVDQADGTYGKERFFRLPAQGAFAGPTHEAFLRHGGPSTSRLEGVFFEELGKSREQYRSKAERDVAILSQYTRGHPEDPRWFYYLGDSYAGLERNEEAIAAFRACTALRGWDEEGAWAMYRAGECLLKLNRAAEAVEACAIGMSRHAGLAELPWLAGYASWKLGRPEDAVHWARMSVILGHFAGVGKGVARIGFRHPPALYEGPFDILRFALRQIGDSAGAEEAERLYAAAKRAREEKAD